MRRDDVRFAAAARDDGLRKISKLTWRAGAAGVLCSAAIAVAFGHHVAAQQPVSSVHGSTGGASSGTGGASSSTGSGGTGGQGTGGSGSQGTSSSAGTGGTGSQGTSGGTGTSGGGSQGTIGVPAQPPAPASGGGQVTSGGT
ncbi:MAG TPA: hypothetical protein VMC03_02315 [Streptosporangiaceae bacterium]|nr:hypothetical protein [Streptosporangiaceae bacterium]